MKLTETWMDRILWTSIMFSVRFTFHITNTFMNVLATQCLVVWKLFIYQLALDEGGNIMWTSIDNTAVLDVDNTVQVPRLWQHGVLF